MHHHRVIVVGSGFGGICTGARLREAAIDDFVLLERADAVGGVWRDNTYPGCACDVQSHLYSLSFAPKPDWSRAYAPQAEIRRYLEGCVDRFGLQPHLRLGHEVHEARWDDEAKRWEVETSHGLFTGDVLVAAVGALSDPAIPQLPGLERFAGKAMHSARWDHGYDLRGKRVAVIGTGASANQFLPVIQREVQRLLLFQRTPAWVLPRHDRTIAPALQRIYRAFPPAQRLVRGLVYLTREALAVGFLQPWILRRAQRLATRNIARSIGDPALREKLTPRYRMGCKRILLSDDYYPALAQPNVEVVTDAIREIHAHSIVDAAGTEHEVDCIVFGTGFHVTDLPFARQVRGREGRTLAAAWAGSPKAYLGTTVAGFPNLFLLLGPNTGTGHTSVVTMIESQVDHLLGALRHLDTQNLAAVEPRAEVQADFVREMDRRSEGTVWTSGGCESWYLDRTGRNSTLWPGFTFSFKRRVERFDPADYRGIPERRR